MKSRIKTVLGIVDDLQDDVLEILIENVESHLKGLLKGDIPDELNYIVEEITIRRFNRLGTEGMKSETVEGHRVDFYDLKDEFTPYMDVIDDYRDHDSKAGKVVFF